jgi:hypothetical protein
MYVSSSRVCNVFVVEIRIGPSTDVVGSIRVLRIKTPVRCCRGPNAGMAFEMYISRVMRAMWSKVDGWVY